MKRTILICSLLAGIFLAAADAGFAQGVGDLRLFEQHCTNCHGNPSGPAGAPDGLALRRMTAEAVLAAITGPVHPALQGITDEEKKMIAGYLRRAKADVAKVDDAKLMPNRCASNPPMSDISAGPMWNGWGADPTTNARFQSGERGGLGAAQVPNLKLKWAFGFPLAEEAYSQPTVAGGRVFVGSDAGTVYSLDAATGCVYWSFQADGAMRVAISVAPVKGAGTTKYAAYFGDQEPTCTGSMPRAAKCCGR